MAIKVKAIERNVAFDKSSEKWAYVLQPELYSKLSQSKVITEAALRSGISKGAINAAWDAIGEVIKAWATEGHAVAIPGLGSMRFGLRSKSIADVNKVGSDLITTRRVIFVPNVEIKDELKRTSINITCYDRNGELVKRVTSSDEGNVEDPEEEENGSSTGSETGGEQGSENQTSDFALTISKSGTGTSTVKDANDQVIESGASLASGASVNIAIVPAEGKIPTATINGTNIQLTESEGTYVGSFEMPAQASTLAINSGTASGNDDDDLIQN